jgi:protein-tyrosine phosphatase
MAAAMLAQRLARNCVTAEVSSAGTLIAGAPPPPEVIAVMARYGADVSGHRSRVLSVRDLDGAGLVLTMTRALLRRAVVMAPSVWPRAFTLRELVRRGEQAGQRLPGEDLAGWLARSQAGRTRQDLLGDCPDDDIADPYGAPPQAYAETAGVLDQLIARMVSLCWGTMAAGGSAPVGSSRCRVHPAGGTGQRLAWRDGGEPGRP